MSKSVFDQKWHRTTLWAEEQRTLKVKAMFLEDHGWSYRTAANGHRLWVKQVEDMLFVCNLETACSLQHAELFDKSPMTQLSLSPCESTSNA